MKKILLIFCLIGLSPLIRAENWIAINSDDIGSDFFDTKSVTAFTQNAQPYISYLIKTVYTQPQPLSPDIDYTYSIAKIKGDCIHNRYTLMQGSYFDSTQTLLETYTVPQETWQTIEPDSMNGTVMKSACYIADYGLSP